MNYIILLAGGIGSRTGLNIPKQYHKINGEYIINFLLNNIINEFDKIILVCDEKYRNKILKSEKIIFANNGPTRLSSLQNGFKKIVDFSKDDDLIFIHDAARILLDEQDIQLHKKNAKKNCGLITCNVVYDTMFKINSQNQIEEVIKKENIVAGYNPQSFFWEDLKKFQNDILNENNDLDLSEILLKKNFKIKTIKQIANLRKITIKEDVNWIEGVLKCSEKK